MFTLNQKVRITLDDKPTVFDNCTIAKIGRKWLHVEMNTSSVVWLFDLKGYALWGGEISTRFKLEPIA